MQGHFQAAIQQILDCLVLLSISSHQIVTSEVVTVETAIKIGTYCSLLQCLVFWTFYRSVHIWPVTNDLCWATGYAPQ